jgi:hypothetical protein
MKFSPTVFAIIVSLGSLEVLSFGEAPSPPDLTQPGVIEKIDRSLTYNLGATGLRGWIYTKAASSFDGAQGRTTTFSRQILVTHIGKGSPGDGVLQVGDVILGTDGELFREDARRTFALAIQEAEKQGPLRMRIWRNGRTLDVTLNLRPLGAYKPTAPFDCDKSRVILHEAYQVLKKEPLEPNIDGAIKGLALLAVEDSEGQARARELARKIAAQIADLRGRFVSLGAWDFAYKNLFLCEYFLLTEDREVLPAIERLTLALAEGQGLFGTFGHSLVERGADGRPQPVPPYGPVNSVGLIANLAIVLGKKCGIQHPAIDDAIERGSNFFSFYVDKGAIPYGEHEPWPFHENNGKNAMAAVFFAVQGDKPVQANYFARMALAGFKNREYGHTGQGFSYLWSMLGVHMGGPEAAMAYFREISWQLDLARRCDGSFVYDGGEQYGPGRTEDDTYYGGSSYYGLSPTPWYVLTYAIPLKRLLITGRDSSSESWLTSGEVRDCVEAGHFDLDRKNKSNKELVTFFANWSPIVRSWAAEELASRTEAKTLVPQMIRLTRHSDLRVVEAACEVLGRVRSTEALPALVELLDHPHPWVRFKAASALKEFDAEAESALPGILMSLGKFRVPTEIPFWEDPLILYQNPLASLLFRGSLRKEVAQTDRDLLYPAIRVIARNPDGMTRASLRPFFENHLTLEDVIELGPDLLLVVDAMSPADTMFANEIRMGALRSLTKYSIRQGIDAAVHLAWTQGGHGSENRTGDIMKELVRYGAAAKPVIPRLKELVEEFHRQVREGRFPGGELNARRVRAVEEAIGAIESAEDAPAMRDLLKEFRTYSDDSGKFRIQARCGGLDSAGEEVILETRDGKTIHVPIARLREAERFFLRKSFPTSAQEG